MNITKDTLMQDGYYESNKTKMKRENKRKKERKHGKQTIIKRIYTDNKLNKNKARVLLTS